MASSNPQALLTPVQNNFLEIFFQHTQDFYLTGGTALSAFYLCHRYSEDLDFFTQLDEAFQQVEQIVSATCEKLKINYATVRLTSYFKHLRIGTVKEPLTLHFSRDYAAHLRLPNSIGKILVDSIEDIMANKICAALGRTETKDLIDLYFLKQAGYTIPDYFEPAQAKDGGLSADTLAYALSQFELTDLPAYLINPLALPALKQFQAETIAWLIKKSAPSASE